MLEGTHFHIAAKQLYTMSHKNDTDVAHCNFNAHQPILVIFGTDVAETVCYPKGDLLSDLS